MAACHAQKRKITSFKSAVGGDRFLCVGGTAGEKSAIISHERADTGFVAGEQKNQQATH